MFFKRSISALGLLATLFASTAVADLSSRVNFHIEPQPLSAAIHKYVEQSRVQVTSPSDLVDGLQSAGVAGELSATDALEALLANTGLTYRKIDQATVSLHNVKQDAPTSRNLSGGHGMLRLAQAGEPRPDDKDGSPGKVEEIVVTAHQFREGEIGKANISLIETPQSISVVSADLIKERGITDINDALIGVAGVSRSSTYGFFDAYTIRGYDTALDSLYLDGLITSNAVGTNNELAGLERVEVLKGPASALYGAAPIGGLVNLVSKRPQNKAFLDASVSTGSYDLVEAAIDGNMPLDSEGNLLGRLNLLYRDSDDFVQFSGRNRIYIAPALTWHIGEHTFLTMLASMQKDDDHPWSPVPAEGTVLPNANGKIPYGLAISRSGDQNNTQTQDRRNIGYVFDHEFNERVSFSQTARYTHAKTRYKNWVFAAGFNDGGYVDGIQQGRIIGTYVYGGPYHQNDNNFGIDNRLDVKMNIGGMSHDVMFGVDHRRYRGGGGDDGGVFDPSLNGVDFLNPDYTVPFDRTGAFAYEIDYNNKQTGAYVQDHIGFGERFFVTAGGRVDWVNNSGSKDTAFSPRAGINYLINPHTSVYGVYSRSFTPQLGFVVSFDGSRLDNGEGRNVEVGAKFSDPSGAFSGSFALFELTRLNVATDDPEHLFFYLITGEQKSRGFELEGSWAASPWATFSGAYTNLTAKVTEDERIPIGTRLGNVPRHNLYLSGDFTVQSGPLVGAGANVSVLWNSDRVGDTTYFSDINGDGVNDSEFELPSYAIVDAGVNYTLSDWRLQVGVNNLLDKEYYPDASEPYRVSYGRPRNWRFTFSRRF